MSINFKKQISANNITEVISKVTEQLKTQGFGVLTEINFSQKLKEKIGVSVPETIVIGACNPHLAYEVYQKNTDFLSLIPCNVVVREIGKNSYSIEMIKPSEMVKSLGNEEINKMASSMDTDMQKLLESIE